MSERDVLNVIDRVTAEYGADPRRTYLMGNSMGMFGTLADIFDFFDQHRPLR